MNTRKRRKSKQSKKMIIAVTAVVLAAVLIGIAFAVYFKTLERDSGSSGYVDPNAGDWDDGIENQEEEIESRMLIPGYSGAKMQAGDTVLQISIGNPGENTCYLKASIQLEDGTVLFESGLLEPGKGLEEVELTQTLEAGTYNAVVHYQGYTLDENMDELNSCDSAFTLTVTP